MDFACWFCHSLSFLFGDGVRFLTSRQEDEQWKQGMVSENFWALRVIRLDNFYRRDPQRFAEKNFNCRSAYLCESLRSLRQNAKGQSVRQSVRRSQEILGVDVVVAVDVETIGDLVDGGGVFLELAVGIGWGFEQGHVHVLGVALIEFHSLHEAEDNEAIVGKHPDIAIVIEKDAAVFGFHLEEIAPKKHGLVWPTNQAKEGGGDIEGAAELAVL